MYEKEFSERLTQLRMEKSVSARDMSLSIGQNPGYINSIETGKSLPSMSGFFYICDYLKVSPKDFFDLELQQPDKVGNLMNNIKKLTPKQLEYISELVKDLVS
ncbi:MAG: helix-turn-helix transcriptional regulator [Eubacterium sp.]|nr:helix-turn-helix transcriptional regulator [Eubacterium sp.]